MPQHGQCSEFLFEFMEQFNYGLIQVKFYSLEFTFLTIFQQFRETGNDMTEFINELFVEICET